MSACEMWLKLQSIHEHLPMCSKLNKETVFSAFHIGNNDRTYNDYVRNHESAQGHRKELIDEDVVGPLLPESYSTLVTALEGQREEDLTVDLHLESLLTNTVDMLKPPI